MLKLKQSKREWNKNRIIYDSKITREGIWELKACLFGTGGPRKEGLCSWYNRLHLSCLKEISSQLIYALNLDGEDCRNTMQNSAICFLLLFSTFIRNKNRRSFFVSSLHTSGGNNGLCWIFVMLKYLFVVDALNFFGILMG